MFPPMIYKMSFRKGFMPQKVKKNAIKKRKEPKRPTLFF
jgi:hypothetical protein